MSYTEKTSVRDVMIRHVASSDSETQVQFTVPDSTESRESFTVSDFAQAKEQFTVPQDMLAVRAKAQLKANGLASAYVVDVFGSIVGMFCARGAKVCSVDPTIEQCIGAGEEPHPDDNQKYWCNAHSEWCMRRK